MGKLQKIVKILIFAIQKNNQIAMYIFCIYRDHTDKLVV